MYKKHIKFDRETKDFAMYLDGELVGYAQSGARSPAYEPGPYSVHTEMLVEKFSNWYIGRMAAHCRSL